MYAGRVGHGESRWVRDARPIKVRKKTGQTDWQTDGRQTVTLRLPLDAVSDINKYDTIWYIYA